MRMFFVGERMEEGSKIELSEMKNDCFSPTSGVRIGIGIGIVMWFV